MTRLIQLIDENIFLGHTRVVALEEQWDGCQQSMAHGCGSIVVRFTVFCDGIQKRDC